MILAALLLAQAAPQTAVDAERAFAADAQKDGQWTAFRRWAADDAIMFDPKPVNAQALLKPLKDPPKAIVWAPAKSFVSCDGQVAVNTGPWTRPNGTIGYFTTVWRKQPDGGWKWVLDHGAPLEKPRADAAEPVIQTASCSTKGATVIFPGQPGSVQGGGASADRSLQWNWVVDPNGKLKLEVLLWNGTRHDIVLRDEVAPPQ